MYPSANRGNSLVITAVKQNIAASNTTLAGESISSGSFSSAGGALHITGRVGGRVTTGGVMSFVIKIDGVTKYTFNQFIGLTDQHMNFPFDAVVAGISAGSHTILIENNGGTFATDGNDRIDLVVMEVI